jgi:DNA polymerase elongation subunit (family B)
LQVTYGRYEGDRIWFLTPDGNIIFKTIEELEYPYFYGDRDLSEENGVVSCVPEKINVLYSDHLDSELSLYKISVKEPSLISKYRNKCKVLVESDIPYLERRLGADNVIEWVAPQKVASIDIEVDNDDNVFLIGAEILENKKRGEYKWFSSPEQLIDWLENNHVRALASFNGDNYDYVYLSQKLMGKPHFEYFQKMLFLDVLVLYSKLKHKSPAPLRQIAVDEGLEEKMEIDIGNMDSAHLDQVVPYNKRDVEIQSKLILKYDMINTIFQLANQTGVSVIGDHSFISQIPEFENYVMKNRNKFKVWFSSKNDKIEPRKIVGGYVKQPTGGVHKKIAVMDYSGLYPTVIINGEYNGVGKEVFILVKEVVKDFIEIKKLYDKLKKAGTTEAEKDLYNVLRDVYKILANGSYGIFANSWFRYHNPDIAEFITLEGRRKREELEVYLNDEKHLETIGGDTDSSFVKVGSYEEALELEKDLNKILYPFEVSLDKYFEKVIIFTGADKKVVKKKYAGLDSNGKVKIVGLEAIRKEWCRFSRNLQKQALDIILKTEDEVSIRPKIISLWSDAVNKLETGNIPLEDLLITKSIKIQKEYKVLQPHVKAYLRLQNEVSQNKKLIPFVSYWITSEGKKNGVVPVGVPTMKEELKNLNIKYYKTKQIDSLMERVLLSLDGVDVGEEEDE